MKKSDKFVVSKQKLTRQHLGEKWMRKKTAWADTAKGVETTNSNTELLLAASFHCPSACTLRSITWFNPSKESGHFPMCMQPGVQDLAPERGSVRSLQFKSR